MGRKEYAFFFSENRPEMRALWDGPVWSRAEPLEIASFRPEGSSHRPRTLCKLLYSSSAIHGLFRVEDRYVRCVHTGFQSEVYEDSCVEFFVQPRIEKGYFNFEFNCGGAMLASYVTDPERVDGRLKAHTTLTRESCSKILLYHSQPETVDVEIEDDLTWYIEFSIPFALFAEHVGSLGKVTGQVWRANFYKCGDATSHPHWGAWAPIDERNFHLPASFGRIRFER